MKKRSEESAKLGVTVQPQVLALGNNISKPEQCFVIINDIVYEMDSIIKSCDICFKSFFVLNVNYPVQCLDPWTFIQRALYRIQTPYDKVVPRVIDLISKLEIN